MVADAVAPCVTRSSTPMILCNTGRPFHGKGFQLSVSIISGGREISIVNTCLCFSWKKTKKKTIQVQIRRTDSFLWVFVIITYIHNVSLHLYYHSRCHFSQRTHDAITTLLWRQNDVAPSFWCHNDVVIALWIRRVITVAMVSIHKMRYRY